MQRIFDGSWLQRRFILNKNTKLSAYTSNRPMDGGTIRLTPFSLNIIHKIISERVNMLQERDQQSLADSYGRAPFPRVG